MKVSPRRYISTNGFTILVGRNSKENSYLTLNYADDKDLFLHVADFPGSHVILRHSPDRAFLIQDITEAAHLAVHYSKAKKGRVKVDYTPISEVFRPKGAYPGEVELRKYKTLKMERDDKKLAKIVSTINFNQ